MSATSSFTESPSSKPIRCLVIQLTRLGDTLQSLMALRAAQQLYPNLEITFVARERFAAAAKRVPWIKQVVTLPTDAILGPIVRGEKHETQGLGDIARWIAPLVKEPWDMVVNWSYSESSSFLTGLLPSRVKLGYSRRRDTGFSAVDGWSHYIQAIVQGGVSQNIHLTDVFTTQLLTALQIHFGDPASDGNAPVTSKSFFTLAEGFDNSEFTTDLKRKWIGIQLGAGSDLKTWEPENWARLAASILESKPDHHIVLMGGKEDLPRARRFLAELTDLNEGSVGTRILSLVGETDFDVWASVVGRCQWVLSCDTAAIHLASVLGTRVFNLSIGPVRWTETGPYGNGHYVITSKTNGGISPEAAFASWNYATGELTSNRRKLLAPHSEKIRLLRSRIRSTEDGGGVVYEDQERESLSLEDWTAMAMGHIARAWYCGWVPPMGQGISRETVSPTLLQTLRQLDEASEVLSKVCEEASRTAMSLKRKSGELKSIKIMRLKDREEITLLGNKLTELDQLIERLGRTHSPLKAFGQMSKVLMHNLDGNEIAELGVEAAKVYKQLGEGITILRDWVKHTLKLARPVALRPAAVRSIESLT